MDDDETWTAYHEAGHGVIAYALGGCIDSMGLGGEADEWLPKRFGDCRISWGQIDPRLNWQRQREVLTVLAGPVAEMVYRSEPLHPAHYGPWQHDWSVAWRISANLISDERKRTEFLERLLVRLHRHVDQSPCWPAIAALADELLAHECLERQQIESVIGFWFRHG